MSAIAREGALPAGFVPPETLKSLNWQLGDLPEGDVPLAWYASTHGAVIEGWNLYLEATRQWNTGYAELLDAAGLKTTAQYMTTAKKHFIGIVPPKGAKPNRWMRVDRDGLWVPRKRTTAEKQSVPSQLFDTLREIPEAVDFVDGMPNTLWSHNGMPYPVVLRRNAGANPNAAVLAFVGADPDTASPPFEVGPQWTRMKLSTYHLLREHQQERRR